MLKRGKKFLIAVLTGTMLLGAAACGGKDATPKEDTKQPATAAETDSPVTIKMMANYSYSDISDADKKFYDDIVFKKTNVKIEFEVPPTTGYNERLQLMLVSGNYPDAVFFPATNNESFLNAVRSGIILPVNDYLKNAPNLMKHTYDISWDALKVKQDDNIYGIPRTSVTRASGLFFRKDWLDNVGLSIPQNSEITLDEFTEILRRFSLNDPDKNGKKDTFGIGSSIDNNKVMSPILTDQFDVLGWQKSSGKYEYMSAEFDRESDNYIRMLEYTAKLYKEGLIDPDSVVNAGTATRDRFWKGVTGSKIEFAGSYDWFLGEMRKINTQADLTHAFVKNEKGEFKGQGYGTGLWGFWAITKNAENPEAVVKVFDYMLSDEGWSVVNDGIEGIEFTVQDGKKVYTPDAINKKIKNEFRRNTVRRANNIDFFIGASTPEESIKKITPWLEKSIGSVVLAKDRDFTPEASRRPDYMDYMKTLQEIKTKILVGESPASEYKKALDGWYKNGGEEYVKQMNEFIKKIESAK